MRRQIGEKWWRWSVAVGLCFATLGAAPASKGSAGDRDPPVAVRACDGLRIPAGAVLDRSHSHLPLVMTYRYRTKSVERVAPAAEQLADRDGWIIEKRDDHSDPRGRQLLLQLARGRVRAALHLIGARARGNCGLTVTRFPDR